MSVIEAETITAEGAEEHRGKQIIILISFVLLCTLCS